MSTDIRELQRRINAAGYTPPLVVDGIHGPRTAAGLAWLEARTTDPGVPPAARVPVGAWLDRRGVLDPDRSVAALRGIVDEVSLFVSGLAEKGVSAFVPLSSLPGILTQYRDAGLPAIPMAWLFPPRGRAADQYRALFAAAAEVGCDLELDAEGPIAHWTADDHTAFRDLVAQARVDGFDGVIRINDYASQQSQTERLIYELIVDGHLVEACPQAYSVDRVSYGGPALCLPGGLHWPGVTQPYAARVWEDSWAAGARKSMGLACYKQRWSRPGQVTMDPATSMRMQLRGATAARVERVMLWDGYSLTTAAPGLRKAVADFRIGGL